MRREDRSDKNRTNDKKAKKRIDEEKQANKNTPLINSFKIAALVGALFSMRFGWGLRGAQLGSFMKEPGHTPELVALTCLSRSLGPDAAIPRLISLDVI